MDNYSLPMVYGEESNNILLIIGEASTNYRLGDIFTPRSLKELLTVFGECQLTECYEMAINKGLKHVFVANAKTQNDYLNIASVASYYSFAYITLIDRYLSDTFFDGFNNKLIYYADLLLSYVDENTTIFITEDSANLYEDIDHYLLEMYKKHDAFMLKSTEINYSPSNLVFCLDNINSNIPTSFIVCLSLLTSPSYDYPIIDTFYETTYDLDTWDIRFNACYLKNIAGQTTVENLINFSENTEIIKFVPIDRILKNIRRELDLSKYTSRLFNEVLKVNIYKDLESYLKSKINVYISDFKIENIRVEVNEIEERFSVNIILDFTIIPLFTIEAFKFILEA